MALQARWKLRSSGNSPVRDSITVLPYEDSTEHASTEGTTGSSNGSENSNDSDDSDDIDNIDDSDDNIEPAQPWSRFPARRVDPKEKLDRRRTAPPAAPRVFRMSIHAALAHLRNLAAVDTWPRTAGLSRIWKYLLLACVVYIALTLAAIEDVRSAVSALSTTLSTMVCSIPFSALFISGCGKPVTDHSIDPSGLAASQEKLYIVTAQVGQGSGLARDMITKGFAIGDLKTRVKYSDLKRKSELVQDLDLIIVLTRGVVKQLSQFTAKVSGSVDTAKSFDDYAVGALEAINKRQRKAPSLMGKVLNRLFPGDPAEEQVKQVLLYTTTKVSDTVKVLIKDSSDLAHKLNTIQDTLGHLREVATDEFGKLGRLGVLAELWVRVADPGDAEQFKAHGERLNDMVALYSAALTVMEETGKVLNDIEGQLNEVRDDMVTPGLVMKEYSLESVIQLLRRCAERLDDGKTRLMKAEENGPASAVTATIL
ncbi:hypothetical protein B0T16DRAFT_454987 [Cercophora newfieldiana]|uniref:Uncharacterized protein n=1 Tax=Cercophora newfieldiana TaxID=92897 RepID=A0AA39YHE8_9PEZI|nr:hypothetical protein B0T16DRAFT_454987 [Cercophora newfieldiana]